MADLLNKENDPLFKAFVQGACEDLKHGADAGKIKESIQAHAAPAGVDRDSALNEFASHAGGRVEESRMILSGRRSSPSVHESKHESKRDIQGEADKAADDLLTKLLSNTK